MKIHFNHNARGELNNGELEQLDPIEVRVTNLELSLFSMIWLVFKFMLASAIATAIMAILLMLVGAAFNLNFHSFHSLRL